MHVKKSIYGAVLAAIAIVLVVSAVLPAASPSSPSAVSVAGAIAPEQCEVEGVTRFVSHAHGCGPTGGEHSWEVQRCTRQPNGGLHWVTVQTYCGPIVSVQ